MTSLRTVRLRAAGIVALASTALVLAACGSSSSSTTSAAAAPAATGTTSSAASAYGSSTTATTAATASSITIATAKTHGQTYLTGASGRSLYLWVADKGDKSSCSGACASVWPPVIAKGKPTAGSGVNAADLGTTMRSDGSEQVTYNGHPLYYYAADTSAGSTKGQGSNGFGAKWWLVAPSGSAITSSGSSTGSSSGSSSGGWG